MQGGTAHGPSVSHPVCIITQVNTFGANNPLTNLVPSLQEVDPDDAFSSVPYEKGFALLYHLEELMGGPGNAQILQGFSNCLTLKLFLHLFC